MAKEYLDVLDQDGNKTGITKLRSDVHRDGDFHRSVHIWIINDKNEILLQRRCATKDSYPNMLDISSAGHLSAGDTSFDGAVREIKEELNLDVNPSDLKLIKTLKKHTEPKPGFINNEFADVYIYKTNKKIDDMKFQEEEISEIMFVPFDRFREMVLNHDPELLRHEEEFQILFDLFDK